MRILALFLFCIAGMAFGQDGVPEVPIMSEDVWKTLVEQIANYFNVDNFIATYLIVMTGLRALAEGGGYLANKTGSKFDNKMVQWFAKGLNLVSWLAGMFGIGTPRNTTAPKIIKKAKS